MASMSGADDTVYLEKRGGRQDILYNGCIFIPCSGKRLTHFSRGSEWPSECSCFNRLKLFPAAGINFQKIVLFVWRLWQRSLKSPHVFLVFQKSPNFLHSPHPTPSKALSVRWYRTIFTPSNAHAHMWACALDFGSHGLSARRAQWTKLRRPKGPQTRGWGSEGP